MEVDAVGGRCPQAEGRSSVHGTGDGHRWHRTRRAPNGLRRHREVIMQTRMPRQAGVLGGDV